MISKSVGLARQRIGSLEVSPIGLGGNNFGTDFFGKGCDQDQVTRIINTALDSGINLIDTAEEYSIASHLGDGHSEEMIGVALGGRRNEAVIATKFLLRNEHDPGERGAARVVAAVEGSLRRLGTDHIDLYQQHSPGETPIDEILGALGRLVSDGKVLEVGCANFSAPQIDAAAVAADGVATFRSCQLQYSVLERPDDNTLAAVDRHGVGIVAYFPLASGLLTGKYRRGESPPDGSRLGGNARVSKMLRDGLMARRPPFSQERLDTVDRLRAFAGERGHSLLELAISYLVVQPAVTSVLTGVTGPEQVLANVAAAAWELTADEVDSIDRIVSEEG
jgi:aryl-alcohol dehydrogenase-like predicted oxidoreductase